MYFGLIALLLTCAAIVIHLWLHERKMQKQIDAEFQAAIAEFISDFREQYPES